MKLCTAILLLAFLHHVRSNPHCVGTCYSGTLFPESKDIFRGKHLKGYSYNNITTDDPVKCYSSCVQDCRCKACQMKDVRCELLDEDKTSKADNFTAESGYVYFDLKQTMYQGRQSHMVQRGSCYNGCCRSQPCKNGGTCVEQCTSPKEKFACRCPLGFKGKICEKSPSSCMDILIASTTTPKKDVYRIQRDDKRNYIQVYCAFEDNKAWTLIESFSRENKEFKNKPFSIDYGRNLGNVPSWNGYRVRLDRMKYFHNKSTLFRATCNYPNRESLTRDLLIGRLSDVDIFNKEGQVNECKRYISIDIMGHTCKSCSALTAFGPINPRHIHLDVTTQRCEFKISQPDINDSTDCFGHYHTVDERFTCTAMNTSTTQWWLGEEK
ncbi:uncharacterized protein LOC110233554 [Exaiptasia diaphana]|uniref:EGF-like domain-containing protein n=1 Tax=Exaiptasia diaphana TaxID=2652724 RepID=A0A913WUX5_EXADI|nr:uncharacterized protein LOC110233554 [Exaiptasia diaphana]KXJ17614.1 hypothetical protein AC249_AIPGENE27818 [Exaiptasia diaphana]